MKKHILSIFLIFFLSMGTMWPLFGPGYFPIHDDTQVARVVVMGNALRNGQFPVRWVSDLGYGYGYPIFNFYGPLPYYVGGVLYALGVDAIAATKFMFGLGILLAPLAFYAMSVSFLGQISAVVGSLLYAYAPYHAVQIYVRGSVGEYWSLIFLPLFLWGVMAAQEGVLKRRAILVGGIGLGGMIVSHTLLGYATVVLFIFFLLGHPVFWAARKSVRNIYRPEILRILIVGLGISAFFWLPAFSEMSYTNVGSQIGPGARFSDHFVCPGQLWTSMWGFAGSARGCLDGMSFKLGKLHILLASLSAMAYLVRRRMFASYVWRVGILVSLVSVFLTLAISQFFWSVIPYFAFIQYPWRFLTFAICGLSLLGGYTIAAIHQRSIRLIMSVLVIFVLFAGNLKLFAPQFSIPYNQAAIQALSSDIRFRASKVSDEYLPPAVRRPTIESDVPRVAVAAKAASVDIDIEIVRDTYKKFSFLTNEDTGVRFLQADFPGWKYIVNGKEVTPGISDGIPTVGIPAGRSVVEVRFVNTPVRTMGNLISLVTLAVIFYGYGKKAYT